MVSRLDRLFILLDTGSNESIRIAAAKQLGEVQRIQPDDLHYLLRRIKEFSNKNVWETRVAAGHATKCVLEQVEPWFVNQRKQQHQQPTHHELKSLTADEQQSLARILEQHANIEQILQNFDLTKVVAMCPTLMSMDAIDDVDTNLNSPIAKKTKGRKSSSSVSGGKKTKELLMRQRQLINKELGISMSDSLNLGVSSADIISNDDLQAEYTEGSDCSTPLARSAENQQQDIGRLLNNFVSNHERAIEALKKIGIINDSKQSDQDVTTSSKRWPLDDVTKDYVDDLFNPSWEVRHGSAIALREIVRLHGHSAGRWLELGDDINDRLNQLWLVDLALKTLCVLGLDRFGDFLFDQVVAPVRENAAQLLGCCVASMTTNYSSLIIKILIAMLTDQKWETRHGGILGLKYSLHVFDKEAIKNDLKVCFEPIFKCLGDTNDDVAAEAAASLLPVSNILNEIIPNEAPKLIKFLWDHIAELDELTTSTSNIILLLASLITSSTAQMEHSELVSSIPKLWSLFSHSSTNVRVSVLKAFNTLIKFQKTSCLLWMPEDLVLTALRLVFQRSILENMDEVHPHILNVWSELIRIDVDSSLAQTEQFNLLKYTSQYLNYWLCLSMQPANMPIDRGNQFWLNIRPDGSKSDIKPDGEVYIASSTFSADTLEQQKSQTTRCRLLGTKLLGALYAKLVHGAGESQHARDTLKYLSDMFTHYLKTKSAHQKMISGWAIESWASYQAHLSDCDLNKVKSILPIDLEEHLKQSILETNLCYDELAVNITRLQHEARDFVSSLVASSVVTNLPYDKNRRVIYNLGQIQSMCDISIEEQLTKVMSKKADVSKTKDNHGIKNSENFSSISNKQLSLSKLYQITKSSQRNLSISVLSSLACSLISWNSLPEKLTFVSEPLLDSVENETETCLLDKSIQYLIKLLDILCRNSTNHKQLIESIIDRLVHSLGHNLCRQNVDSFIDQSRIIQLDNLQRKDETSGRGFSRRQSSISSVTGVKRPHSLTSTSSELEPTTVEQANIDAEIKLQNASLALVQITRHFGAQLPEKLPAFWFNLTTDLHSLITNNGNEITASNRLIKSLIVIDTIGESLDNSLRHHLLNLFPGLIQLLTSKDPLIRHHSSKCIGKISKLMLNEVEEIIVSKIIPALECESDAIARCGSIESIALIIENLQLELVPKINMFTIHVLRRMSDQNDQVRLMAAHCFGKLLSLMPLNLNKNKGQDSIVKLEPNTTINHNQDYSDKSEFIEQLLNPKKLTHYKVPFETQARLRTYQQEGINWLAFLNRFNLHGILCDEMGLGKTLMTICTVASDHFYQEGKTSKKPLPSLIVCPSTLIEHWLYEIEKFVPSQAKVILNPVGYAGSIGDRLSLRSRISEIFCQQRDGKNQESIEKPINIVITSYDVLRNDIDFFKTINWNYCVLDEGHMIKNVRSKLSRAIRLLTAAHRLILTGTPIQNNVNELWSLFDFLMPGFLGSERQFYSRYTKPILLSREPKCSPRELEAGALAMESLHRQVLPFILRRLKEDVLDDLPPKIIQDYYCELSPLQLKLYEDFTRSKLCNDVTKKSLDQIGDENLQQSVKANSRSHVFQALQYLKNVCNHPRLVLTPKHPQYNEVRKMLDSEHTSLSDIAHSSKLKALKQLLIDCGIGVTNQNGEDSSSSQQQIQSSVSMELESVVNQHRALVFCQVRSMVDIIENDLLKKHLPNVTYLKLDGSVPTNQRHSIVSRFNNDPSIDVLLLTTQIGGLGLNLTGADTVIFVEHDWNPTRDLQAMDRAHRIGQKKVVNVYRLITKATLEEKIMGLQKFKTMVSSTVINQDNTGLGTMNVDQLFDLFDDNSKSADDKSANGQQCRVSKSNVGDLLPDLWDQQQYDTEYDLGNFVSSLKN